jgi:hypothetical protein
MTAHIVALSGGKDSTAMALRLQEVEPQAYQYVCTPTGRELPDMIEHWIRLGELLGSHLIPVTGGHSLDSLIEGYGSLPNWRQRWCTRRLKIEPFQAWVLSRRPAICYVGLRADEAERPGGLWGDVDGVEQRYPLREWGWKIGDVVDYLASRGVAIPERTDCDCCFFQTLGEWWRLWRNYPERYAKAEAEERATGHTYRSPGRDTWPTSLADLRADFERGRVPRGVEVQLSLQAIPKCRACSL